MERNEKIQIGSSVFLIFFCYVVFIWICEVADLFAFLVGIKQVTIFSRIIVAIISFCLLFLLHKRFEFYKISINIGFLFGTTFIVVFALCKSVFPDHSFDTGNYHLIAQQPGFVNYFTQYFGLGNFQIWGFRLSDRLFYPFRQILGFRLGTSLNMLILIISYFQIIQILGFIRETMNKEKNLLFDEFYAFLVIFGHTELMDLGCYYVDIVAFPIALEILFCLLRVKQTKFNNGEIIYFALLNGFWFALKMTNIVFVIPAVFIFIFLQKNIPLKIYVLCVIFCIIPCLIYLIYNYVCTGNPVFPYFNKIFKSPYFSISNFKDTRWGPVVAPPLKHFLQALFWVFYAVLFPMYRQSEIFCVLTIFYAFGTFAAFTLLVKQIIRKLKNKTSSYSFPNMQIVLWFFVSSILWAFTTGYERYFMFGMVVSTVIGYESLFMLPDKRVLKYCKNILCYVFFIATFFNALLVFAGREWYFGRCLNGYFIKENIPFVIKDRKFSSSFDVSEIDAFFLTDITSQGFAYFMNNNSYIMNLNYINYIEEDLKLNFKNKMKEYLDNDKKVYDVLDAKKYNSNEYADKIKQFDLIPISIENVESNIGEFVLIKLGRKQ